LKARGGEAMKIRLLTLLLVSALITPVHSAAAAERGKDTRKRVEVSSTQRIEFIPRGVIRIQKSFGEMFVDGWDKNEVEVTVIKAIKASDTPEDQERARHKLETVNITASKQSADTILIASSLPFRKNLDLVYRIKVPRESDLFIKHDIGEVTVDGVLGDLEITSRIGEISVNLQDGREYNIDAKVKIGEVQSAFSGKSKRSYLLSEKFSRDDRTESHRVYLRVGIGEIAINKNIGKVAEKPPQ
jgi:hypothetical protein